MPRTDLSRNNITDLLEDIQISSDYTAAHDAGNMHFPKDWFGISTPNAGGYIAYFRDESDAVGFGLWLINSILNGRDAANAHSVDRNEGDREPDSDPMDGGPVPEDEDED